MKQLHQYQGLMVDEDIHISVNEKVKNGPATLVDALRLRAKEAEIDGHADDHSIIYFENGMECKESLATLYHDALRYLGAMQAKDSLKQGDYVLLQLPTRRKHFRVFWACALGGIIPVTVAVPSDFVKNVSLLEKISGVIATLISEGRSCVVLTEDAVLEPLTAALNNPSQGSNNIRTATRVISVDQLLQDYRCATPGQEATLLQPTDVLFLQLTSGSTGIPKCIQETHIGIVTQIVASVEVCGYAYGKTSLNWLPFDHVVPMLTTHLRDVYVGMRQVQIPTAEVLADPLVWLDALAKFRVNFSWSPNFGHHLVNQACHREPHKRHRRWNLEALEFLMNAGEQVTRSVCNLFIENTGISPTVMQPSFGMAESCTCITYCCDYSPASSTWRVAPDSITGVLQDASPGAAATALEFTDLGPVVRGVEIRIAVLGEPTVPERDCVIGHFQIKGPVVTPGYVNRPDSNAEAFVGDGWVDSGDLGVIRNRRLYLTGRYKESICIRGTNLFCYELESQVESVPGVLTTFVAAASVYSKRAGTEELLIFFSPDQALINTSCLQNDMLDGNIRQLMSSVRRKVAEATGISPKVCVPVLPANFHKTTSGKIQRIKFRDLYQEGHYTKLLMPPVSVPSILKTGCFAHAWREKAATDAAESRTKRSLKILVAGASCRSNDVTVLKERIEEAQHVCVEENPEAVLFVGALGPTPSETTSAASRSIQVLADAVQVLCRTSETTLFYAITSTDTDMDKLVGAALHGFVRGLTSEEPCRRPSILAWDRQISSLPRLIGALGSSEFEDEREIFFSKKGVFVRKLELKSFLPRGNLFLKKNATYVITGGTGALGMDLAAFLVKSGARYLALVSRSGESSSVTRNLNPLRTQGVSVKVLTGDISVQGDVDRLLGSLLNDPWPPLKGVFHLAGVYASSPTRDYTQESLVRILGAKAVGAALLHAANLDLDHFVLFSSVAASIGSVGFAAYSAAYSAANLFLDELCHIQRQQNLPALSIQWGPWDHAGGMAGKVDFSFFDRIPVDEGMTALGLLMDANASPGLVLTQFHFSVYKSALSMDNSFVVPHLLTELVARAKVEAPERSVVGAADAAKIVKSLIQDIIGEEPPMDESVMALGVDSAGAMELVGQLSKQFGVRLSSNFVFKQPTPQLMVNFFTKAVKVAQSAPLWVDIVELNEPQMKYKEWTGSIHNLEKCLYLVGSGGHARTVIATLKVLHVDIAGIFTNLEDHVGTDLMGIPVLGLLDQVPAPSESYLHICLGQPLLKQEWATLFPHHSFVAIVDPRAIIDETSCTLGEGCFVGPLAVIDGMVSIGAHSIVEVHALVAHDTKVGSFTLIGGMAAVAGSSVIGDGVVLGTHASTAPKIRVGNRAVLGSGSSAYKNIPEGCTAFGVPAEVQYKDVPIKM
jgi:sugar O-acyltransferase (sialic acid O-acetyltransferase NeuD family)